MATAGGLNALMGCCALPAKRMALLKNAPTRANVGNKSTAAALYDFHDTQHDNKPGEDGSQRLGDRGYNACRGFCFRRRRYTIGRRWRRCNNGDATSG